MASRLKRGRSKAFLLKLRKKYGLGEFKKLKATSRGKAKKKRSVSLKKRLKRIAYSAPLSSQRLS